MPGAPTVVALRAMRGDGQLHGAGEHGSGPITNYTATATPGGATASGSGSPLIVTGLTNGTAYTFRVAATNGAGTGPPSAPSAPVTPVGPLQFVGAPKNFSVTATAGGPVASRGPRAPERFRSPVISSSRGDAGSVLGCVPIRAPARRSGGAAAGTFYVVRLAVGRDPKCGVERDSNLRQRALHRQSAPTNLLGLVNGNSIGLSWVNTAGGGAPAGLILDVSGSLATSVPLPVTESFSTPGVPPGTYTLTVRATNATGTSAPSNPVTLTFPGPCSGAPLTPVGFSATRSGNTITVSWMPPATGPSLASYTLAVSGAFVGSIPTTTRSLSGTVLPGSYTFSVTATNACGTSAATTPQTVTVP